MPTVTLAFGQNKKPENPIEREMHVGVFLQTALANMEQLWRKKHNSLGTHTDPSDICGNDL